MDSWNEHWDWSKWTAAFEQTALSMAFYAHRAIASGEVTPWSHITGKRGVEFLWAEYKRMGQGLETS